MTYQKQRGFTLIELLVVVLMIGILAAVALPQYQKAVLKSRFAALKPLAKAVKNAQEIYYNEHGEYATQLASLDVQAPTGAELDLSDTAEHEFVRAKKTGLNNRYTMYFDHSTQFAGNIYCEALTTDAQAMAVCAGEGGTGQTETNGEYTLYLLSGNGTGSFGPTPPQKSAGASYFQATGCCAHFGGCNTYTYSNGDTIQTCAGSGGVYVYTTESIEYNYNYAEFCQEYPGIETIGNHNCSE